MADCFSYRFGKYSANTSEINRRAFGFSIDTGGVTRALYEMQIRSQGSHSQILDYLLTHVSFRLSRAWNETSNPVLKEQDWTEVRLTL